MYDNFSSIREWHLAPWANDPRLQVVAADVRNLEALVVAAEGHDTTEFRSHRHSDAGKRLSLDMGRSVCVGDRWRDVEAAKRAGVTAVHVDRGYREEPAVNGADAVAPDLYGAVEWITSRVVLGDDDPRSNKESFGS